MRRLCCSMILALISITAVLYFCAPIIRPTQYIANLQYSQNPALYIIRQQITPNVPTYRGDKATRFTIDPSLPAGLQLDASTGRITGIPQEMVSQASYTVTGTNEFNSDSVVLIITISEPAPAGLSYAVPNAEYPVGKPIAANSPILQGGGAPDSFTVSPQLPAGLIMIKSTGVIQGTPTLVRDSAQYTVTAQNAAGSAQAVIAIEILDTTAVQPANHAPAFVSGYNAVSIQQGDTARIKVVVHDSDLTDAIAFTLVNRTTLETALGAANVIWSVSHDTASLMLVPGTKAGNYPAIIRISDGKDSTSVTINVTVGNVNHPPQWKKKIINASVNEGQTWALNLPDTCADPDGNALTFSLLPGNPATDAIGADSIYRFATGSADSGAYVIRIVARDDSAATDTLTINLHVLNVDNDHTAPAIRFLDPSQDSALVATSSRLVRIIVKDSSGVARVVFKFGADSLEAGKTQDSVWSATVTSLQAGFNTITIHAWDSSSNRNMAQKLLTLRYDATSTDVTPPAIRLFDPAQDSTVISQNSRLVKVIVADANGVSAVWFSRALDSIPAARSSDTIWSATVSNLGIGFNSFIIHARDASSNANTSTKPLTIKYDPTLPDNSPPTFTSISGPAADMVVRDSIVTIVLDIYDTSGIDTAYWTLKGAFAGAMTKAGGFTNRYQLVDTLKTWHANRLVIHAIDNATAHNRDSLAMVLDYNLLPTAIATTTPANAAVNVENAGLKFVWTGGDDADGDAVSYIIRYGTDPANLPYGGSTAMKQYTPSPQLKGMTHYYWIVRVCTPKDTAINPSTGTYSFTTRNHPASFSLRMPDDTISINDTIWFRVHATDAEGIKKFQWTFNGVGLQETTTDSIRYISPSTTGQLTVIVAVIDSSDSSTRDTANISITNTAPYVNVGPDILVGLRDLVTINPAVRDDGKIVKYEWLVTDYRDATPGPDTFLVRSKADTSFIFPMKDLPDSLLCILKVTDDEGFIKRDTVIVSAAMKWSLVSSNKIPIDINASNYGTTLLFRDTMWYIGSYDTANNRTTCWYSIDGNNWTAANTTKPLPLRDGPRVAAFKDSIWVTGGVVIGSPTGVAVSDLWKSGNARDWIQVADTGFFKPHDGIFGSASGIFGASILEYKGSLFVLYPGDVFRSIDGHNWNSNPYNSPLDCAYLNTGDTIWTIPGQVSQVEFSIDDNLIIWSRCDPINLSICEFVGSLCEIGKHGSSVSWNEKVWVFDNSMARISNDMKNWCHIALPFNIENPSSFVTKDGKLWVMGTTVNGIEVYNTVDLP